MAARPTPLSRILLVLVILALVFFGVQYFINNRNKETLSLQNPVSQTDTVIKTEEKAKVLFVPPKAAKYLEEKYAIKATDVEWVEQHYGHEAIFKVSGRTYEVEFDKDGNWVETELEDVPAIEIPDNIKNAIKQQFPNLKVQEYEIENTPEGTFYEIELLDGTKEFEIYLDNKGNKAVNKNEDS